MSAETIFVKLLVAGWRKLQNISPRGARIVLIVLGAGWIFGGYNQTHGLPITMPEELRDERFERERPEPPQHRKARGVAVLINGLAVLAFAAQRRPPRVFAFLVRVTLIAAMLTSLALFLAEKLQERLDWKDWILIVATVAIAFAINGLFLLLVRKHELGDASQRVGEDTPTRPAI